MATTKKKPAKKKAAAKKVKARKPAAAPKLSETQVDTLRRVQTNDGKLPPTAYDRRTLNALAERRYIQAGRVVSLTKAGTALLGAA